MACVVFAAAALARGGTVLVDESFADGNRSSLNLPKSLDWQSSAAAGSLTDGSGFMKLEGAEETGRHAVAHFAPADAPVELAVGQSLVLSFDVKPVVTGPPGGNSMRFGLFHSANDGLNIFDADGENPDGTTSEGYVGSLMMKTDMATGLAVLKRQGPGRLLTNSAAYVTAKTGTAAVGLRADQKYSVELEVARNARGVTVQVSVAESPGGEKFSVSYEDPGSSMHAFDTIGFSVFRSVSAAEFSNIRIIRKP